MTAVADGDSVMAAEHDAGRRITYNCGSDDRFVVYKVCAWVDADVSPRAVVAERPASRLARGGPAERIGALLRARLGHLADGRDTQGSDLDLLGRGAVSVALRVGVMEQGGYSAAEVTIGVSGDGHRQRMELAHIPHVESAHEFDLSRGLSIELDPEVGRGILLEGAEELLRFAAVDAAEPSAAHRLRHVMAQIGDEHSEGAERSGSRGDQDSRDPEIARQRRSVQWPGPAVSDHGEVARVPAALDGHGANSLGHDRVRDPDDGVRA